MQLSPLQSRLAASVIASCLLIALYFTLFSPHFAVALELGDPSPIIFDDIEFPADPAVRSPLDPTYEPEFAAFDRSILGRAPAGVTALTSNEAMPMNVDPGTTQLFMFSMSALAKRSAAQSPLEPRGGQNATQERGVVAEAAEEDVSTDADEEQRLARRQSSQTMYISANTCEQPQPVDPSGTTVDPPQLTLYVSTSTSNQSPGPLASPNSQVAVAFKEGAVMYNFSTSDDVYLGIFAPNFTKAFAGTFNFQVAASTDNFFHSYNVADEADLIWVDSDSQGALLITHNLTESSDPALEAKLMSSQPYVMFAQNTNDISVNGLKYSYCGLQNYAQIAATKNGQFTSMVQTGMTKRGPGNLPKQEFFFSGLNSSSNYIGILAREGNSSVSGNGLIGGGGHVFKATNFSTKSDHGNCGIVFNLDFCDQVAYSVPSNPKTFGNATQLAKFYDDFAATMYDNFNKSLQQVACEAPSDQRYSLVRNCTDCAAAYKDWLCFTTIPRCEDFSNDASYLQPRAVAQPFPNGDPLDGASLASLGALVNTGAYNSSRNPLIDSVVQPGPYKEVLPCEDLCYNIVQSCPAALGFSCPTPGRIGFATSYGQRVAAADDGSDITCNYPGSAHFISASSRTVDVASWGRLGVAAAIVGFGILLL